MLKPAAVRRSACDQCRARRVQCLRAQNSTAPCARCAHIGARCATSAPGHPGRPRKSRLALEGDTPSPRGPAPSPSPSTANVASPGRHCGASSALRDINTHYLDVHAHAAVPAPPPAPPIAGDGAPTSASAPPVRAFTRQRHMHTSWDRDRLDAGIAGIAGIGESNLGAAHLKSTAHPSTTDPLAHDEGPQPAAADFWSTPGDSSLYFDSSPSTDEQSPAPPGEDLLALVDQLGSPSQLHGLLGADDELSAMLHMGRDSNSSSAAALDMDVVDPLLDPWKGMLPTPTPLPQCPSPASALMRFREEMDQRIAAMDAYYSDPVEVVQGCKEEGAARAPENPAAVLLTCSKEFIDIIQGLTTTSPGPTATHKPPPGSGGEDALSTEIVLLALSSYLSLMRLFDAMFHTIHQFISQLPPDSFKSVKVKSVLRIGGITALQDMPLKAYAASLIDAIRAQVRTLERCMGIPAEYCLEGETAASAAGSEVAAAPGILSRPDRAWLFGAVLAQEDVRSRRGSKSYVESIRTSIQESMRFLDD